MDLLCVQGHRDTKRNNPWSGFLKKSIFLLWGDWLMIEKWLISAFTSMRHSGHSITTYNPILVSAYLSWT